jgi:hypothetical protein
MDKSKNGLINKEFHTLKNLNHPGIVKAHSISTKDSY